MSKSKKFLKRKTVCFFLILGAFVYLNNSSIFLRQEEGKPLLLAHRGLGQTFPLEGISGETNTAARIYPPEHSYLENTIPSMEVAFQAGADIVELDVQPTTDGQFAVFHDWILDYRTNGKGVTREHTMSKETLKKAFIPYLALGWTGYLPAAMKNAFFYLPQKYARLLWGWPHRFIKRIKNANSIFVLVAGEGVWSEGFDTAADLKEIPTNYTGGIWTNRIDRIGPMVKDESDVLTHLQY